MCLCVYIFVLLNVVTMKTRTRHPIPSSWSYRGLRTSQLGARIKLGSSLRDVPDIRNRPICPAAGVWFSVHTPSSSHRLCLLRAANRVSFLSLSLPLHRAGLSGLLFVPKYQLTYRSRCHYTVCTHTGTLAPCFPLLWAQTRAGHSAVHGNACQGEC